jgi:hypothetical protein
MQRKENYAERAAFASKIIGHRLNVFELQATIKMR